MLRNINRKGVRARTRGYKPSPKKLKISKIANRPYQLQVDVTKRVDIEQTTLKIIADDGEAPSVELVGDEQIPSKVVGDDDEFISGQQEADDRIFTKNMLDNV